MVLPMTMACAVAASILHPRMYTTFIDKVQDLLQKVGGTKVPPSIYHPHYPQY